jgi:hypothetical protein
MICFTHRRGIGLRGGRWSFRKVHCVHARSGEGVVSCFFWYAVCEH